MSISYARSARRVRSEHCFNASAAPGIPLAARRRDDCFRCRATSCATARRCSIPCGAESLIDIAVPEKPLDVLAQQIVAEVALQEWKEDELLALYQRAYPYRNVTREEFNELVLMLSDGFHTARGRRSAHLHHDAVNGVLRGRRGAALAAVTSGGAIPTPPTTP